jgi:ABC-type glycerol-3-phosphate transport system permease component
MPGNPYGLPKTWYWNFSFVIENFIVQATDPLGLGLPVKVGLLEMFGNSILYSLGCSFFHTFVMCLTAYACARFPYKYSKIIHTTVIVVMIIPIVGNAPSELAMAIRLGIYNKIWGMWMMRANFLGMYFLVFHGMVRTLGKEYWEAAYIDGAGQFTVLFRIILPLLRNTIGLVILLLFIQFWNDYQTPLLYVPSYPTIAYGIYDLSNTFDRVMSSVPMKMTACIVFVMPILLLYIVFKDKLMGNVTMGGIKE